MIDHQTKDIKSVTADNVIVTQDDPKPKDPALTAIVDRVPHRVRADREPDRRRDHGGHHARPTGGDDAERRVGARRRDRGRQLKATAPTDFGASVIAFMNPGGIRGGLLFASSPGGEPRVR